MTKTTIELLREAREWLSVEEHWCTVNRWHSDGVRNCAIGALERASGAKGPLSSWLGRSDLFAAFKVLGRALGAVSRQPLSDTVRIGFYNDQNGWAKVRELFDSAIKLEQEDIDNFDC